jgi:hypothetical protein
MTRQSRTLRDEAKFLKAQATTARQMALKELHMRGQTNHDSVIGQISQEKHSSNSSGVQNDLIMLINCHNLYSRWYWFCLASADTTWDLCSENATIAATAVGQTAQSRVAGKGNSWEVHCRWHCYTSTPKYSSNSFRLASGLLCCC